MKTLLLDNYDSFSHILYQYLWEVNGEKPLFIHNDEWTLDRIRAARFDNILISPGPGRPDIPSDFGVCGAVIAAFPDRPILGVCLGHQGLGIFAGASVAAAPQVRHGKASRILHDGSELFAGLPQGFMAVRYHSLVIAPEGLPPGLGGSLLPGVTVTATSEDDGQIMGLRLESRPCYGVQFHPESIGTEHGKALLANFRDITARRVGSGPGSGSAAPSRATRSMPTIPPAPSSRPLPPARELPWREPEAVFDRFFRDAQAAFWLDSLSAPVPGEPLVTYMGTGSRLFEIKGRAVSTLRVEADGSILKAGTRQGDPLAILSDVLGPKVTWEVPKAGTVAATRFAPGAFRGGLVGYLGYELKRDAGGSDLPETPESDLPDGLLLEPSRMLAFDHAARKVYAFLPEPGPSPEDRQPSEDREPSEDQPSSASDDRTWLETLSAVWHALGGAQPMPLTRTATDTGGLEACGLPLRLSADREAYLSSIRSLQASILRGESYEACLTNEIRVAAGADPFEVYRILRRTNPSPYAAYLQFPRLRILSASPERFLKLDAAGTLACRPIKGTRRRGSSPAEDAAIRAELAANPKDRSENLMIVDIVRNDFGKVCALGSVTVPESMRVEEHPTVFQLVSGVEGRVEAPCAALEAVRACFPGGSMTGAPKKRTMELIEALEKRPRGVFSGALGWFGRDGAMDLGMVIRTLVHRDGEFRIGCGGAILAESDPEGELEEAMLKAWAPLRAVELAVLGESGGWTLRA